MYLWQVTDDITSYTSADLFSSVGKSTDVIVRFSQVTGLLGSPDWMRAPQLPSSIFQKRAYSGYRLHSYVSAHAANACTHSVIALTCCMKIYFSCFFFY